MQPQTTPQQAAEDHKQRVQKAREKMLRSRLYKIMAIGLGLAGFVIAVSIYQTLGKGDPVRLVRNPVIIFATLLPFVPGFFLGILSKKKRAEASGILKPLYGTVNKANADTQDEAA